MAVSALWAGGESVPIVDTLLEALREMLGAIFVFARLDDPGGGPSLEVMRGGAPAAGTVTARELGAMLDGLLGAAALEWPASARVSMGGGDVSLASVRLGLEGEFGMVVAGCREPGFPGETERLLLDVAASQAAMGLQQAHVLTEQKRAAREIDALVAQRASERAAASEELEKEVAERHRAEEALRTSEREWRLIVDNIPGLVALLAATGDVEIVNRQLLEYFGKTLEELKDWGRIGIIHPDDLPHVVEVFTRSLGAGTPYDILQRFRRSDGVFRWFQNSGFPLRDPDGKIVHWCVLLTDIDERKRAEDALRRSERNLQLIIDTIPALAWSARPDGSADFFNQHYLDFVGFSAEQARDWGWMAAVHADDLSGLAATWHGIMASEAPGEAEARLRRHDGEHRWFLFRTNPLRDENGSIIKWYGVNTDIEDRKRAEAELRQAYGRLTEAQRLSRTGSFITDLAADERAWSDEALRIFEFDPSTRVTLQAIRALVHPEDLPAYDAAYEVATVARDWDLTFRIITSSGNVKHLHAVGHVMEMAEGRPVFIGAIQDVTESKVAEEALDRARSELAHVARAATLSTLTASIAHEVNQPLSGIITNASTCLRMLAADPPNVDGAKETARRTIRDGHRASDVIARLRALFSRKEFTLELVDLNEALQEVIALSWSDLQRSRVALSSELAADLPLVTGDRVQLQQVVLNLLRNASEAMVGIDDRPRHVLVRTEREDGGGVRVSVRDAGVGIEGPSTDKLFDAFYTTKSGGMGMGLSVSRSIVERHHGRLWAEPNDGPGATFAFSIPCVPGPATDTAPA